MNEFAGYVTGRTTTRHELDGLGKPHDGWLHTGDLACVDRDWAAEDVSERGAAPKSVTVLDALPVTAVGKSYKLGLRADAAEEALTDALAGLGAGISVTTEIDDGAVTARLTLSPQVDQAAVKAVVDAFTIPWKLEVQP